jgi:hypothetical protein
VESPGCTRLLRAGMGWKGSGHSSRGPVALIYLQKLGLGQKWPCSVHWRIISGKLGTWLCSGQELGLFRAAASTTSPSRTLCAMSTWFRMSQSHLGSICYHSPEGTCFPSSQAIPATEEPGFSPCRLMMPKASFSAYLSGVTSHNFLNLWGYSTNECKERG